MFVKTPWAEKLFVFIVLASIKGRACTSAEARDIEHGSAATPLLYVDPKLSIVPP